MSIQERESRDLPKKAVALVQQYCQERGLTIRFKPGTQQTVNEFLKTHAHESELRKHYTVTKPKTGRPRTSKRRRNRGES